ncbi:peptidoglycan-binding protein [Myxococcus sp. CA056]|uniref:peptidoglycan-binding protein n=1 Tax=Myxococcus sp. CA056 TaxID=2741740 RepID=UPI00157A494C|nr:peptidoglycan-binding protein [Myxococcus sp. CA056]NTX12489.1 peptidoglycan-binding protein [Myxococcus sp. CA056]
MSTRHKVKQGEWLSKIARQYGFAKWQELWDHPDNAPLRAKRTNPFCLQVDDEVVIPELPGLKVSAGSSYSLQGGDPPDRIRLGMRRANAPLGLKRYELKLGEKLLKGTLTFQGLLDQPLPPEATEATLKVWTSEEPELSCEWQLKLGHLDPLDALSGVQARLANLGWYNGPINNELTEDTRTALASFQLALLLTPTGELSKETLESLADRHEQNGGTEVLPPSFGSDDDEEEVEEGGGSPGGESSAGAGAPPPPATGSASASPQGGGSSTGGSASGTGGSGTTTGATAQSGTGTGSSGTTTATTAQSGTGTGGSGTTTATTAQSGTGTGGSGTTTAATGQTGGGTATGGAATGGTAAAATAQQSATAVDTHRYGGFVLQRRDRDDQHRWGGAVQPVAQGNNGAPTLVAPGTGTVGNALTAPTHVLRLQRDLRELGFLIGGTPDGAFGLGTDWAVREFQIYSKMENVAQEDTANTSTNYVERLSQVANTQIYQGAVSGIVNDDTEQRIRHWLTNRWRCPVIVRAMNVANGNPTTVFQDNLWRHDDCANTAPRIYVRDFTGYYTLPTGRNEDDLRVLGTYTTYPSYGGPVSMPTRHTWATSELLPSNLVGVANYNSMTASQRSTYKVVRAAAEQENLGYFDSLNAYDNAFISLGPCHWTLGILFAGSAEPSEGELCGFLAYLRSSNQAAFEEAIEFFGLRIDEDWDAGAGNGATLYSSSGKKYSGWPAQQRDDATWARMDETESAGNYYKTYHWYYRFQMAGRTIEGFQRAMWNAARIRLRDIRDTPWGTGVANVGTGANARAPTVGDVATSEKLMGILLRWHIFRPGHVAAQNSAGQRLRNAFTAAKQANPTLNWTQAPNLWTNAHETALITHILAEASSVNDSVDNVANWPGWLGGTVQTTNPRNYQLALPAGTTLLSTRNSFNFDVP